MRCSMSVLACTSDADYVRMMYLHLKRTTNFEFAETFLVLDTMRDSGETLLSIAQSMRASNEIDRYIEIDRRPAPAVIRKHFSKWPRRLRDNRGIPLFGWIIGIENADTDYLFHSDCDVLIYSRSNYSWVRKAMEVMESDPSVVFVSPHPGPPSSEGIFGHNPPPTRDANGNYRFKSFSSRRYVVHRKRFELLLPLAPLHVSPMRKAVMYLGGPSSIRTWERHVNAALKLSPYHRVSLGDTQAWALHCPDHGPLWRDNLPALIAAVEAGRFPPSQGGHYDLRLNAWLIDGLIV
jgi:hypothetical protein